jgi:hypothetical protein
MDLDRHPGKMRWHYTVWVWWEDIRRDGVVKAATAYVTDGEKPAVWFSVNEFWEETANKNAQTPDGRLVILDREGTRSHGGGLVRIGVAAETAPHDWNAHKVKAGLDKRIAKGLYDAALSSGARPGEWYVSYDPVPRSLWLAVERWDEVAKRWEPIDADEWHVETNTHSHPDDDQRPVPIAAFFDSSGVRPNKSPDYRPRLAAAQIILGVDRTSGNEFLLYGRELLERIARGTEAVPAAVLRIEMDQETDDLERATALVELVKGRHDYRSSPGHTG